MKQLTLSEVEQVSGAGFVTSAMGGVIGAATAATYVQIPAAWIGATATGAVTTLGLPFAPVTVLGFAGFMVGYSIASYLSTDGGRGLI